jgi:hypothetical protein
MNAPRRLIAPILILIILLTSWDSANAQSTGDRYFPETGHFVRGAFLQFYENANDPLLVYGYPITEQVISRDGKTVQYFQRARFELTNSQTVQLTPLGRITYRPKSPLLINSNGCELFSSGYRVCFTFLDFYKASGGPAQFGNPISPFESHDGGIVQYFEGARFEWNPSPSNAQQVTISDLGRLYFEQIGEDPAHLKPVQPRNAAINPVLSIKTSAFVTKSVTRSTDSQTVHIIVQSQTLQAVSGATGKATVRFPDGRNEDYVFTTNALGIAQIPLNFSNQKSGELVPIEITVTYGNLTGRTRTSFRIWF